jgi:hypothetical protein
MENPGWMMEEYRQIPARPYELNPVPCCSISVDFPQHFCGISVPISWHRGWVGATERLHREITPEENPVESHRIQLRRLFVEGGRSASPAHAIHGFETAPPNRIWLYHF